jgi:aminoglycoside phosphotransferase (APT) family kinase protein
VPLPVPEVVAVESDHLVLTRVPGSALLHLPRVERRAFAAELLEFVAVVHSLEVDVPVDDTPLEAWLDEAREIWPSVRHLVPAAVEKALDAAPGPAAPRVFIHGDLGAEHVFAAGGRLTGVIDWSDAAIGDPALDHGRLMRDFGVAGDERARLYAICTAIEDLAYGREPYVSNAAAALAELCPA